MNQKHTGFSPESLRLIALIADDGYAASFQSMGQYRTALIVEARAVIGSAAPAPAELGIGVSNNDQGVHISVMRQQADGSLTVLHSAKCPEGDSFSRFTVAPAATTSPAGTASSAAGYATPAADAGVQEATWKLVPVEPTVEMRNACYEEYHKAGATYTSMCRAIIAAAPARTPATSTATPSSAAPAEDGEAAELLDDLIANIRQDGNYSVETTLTFLGQIRQCIAAPVAAAAPAEDADCDLPPPGWYCTRARGHDGPCAAHPGVDHDLSEGGHHD